MLLKNPIQFRNLLNVVTLKWRNHPGMWNKNGLRISVQLKHTADNGQVVEYLMELTGCTKEKAESAIKKRSLDREDIESTNNFLKKMGVKDLVNHLAVLTTHPLTLENHYMIFEEIGIRKEKIDCFALENFYRLFNSTSSKLKKQGLLHKDANVRHNCLSHAGLSIDNEQNEKQEDVRVSIIHRSVLTLLLKNKLSQTWTYEFPLHKRLHYKSLRLISSTYDILTQQFEISEERIINNTALLTASPHNLRAIFDGLPTLGGIKTKDIINRWPKIAFNSYSALSKINASLKEFNVSSEAVAKTPLLFTLNPDNVQSRLQVFKSHPELSVWSFHPQALRIVLYQRKILKRLNELKENNLRCASIFLFQCKDEYFNRRKEGLDKSSGCDVIWLMKKTFHCNAESIRRQLKKHPHWLFVPLANIKATLDLLLERNFTKEDILKSVIILLYPVKTVEEELNKLPSQMGLECCKQGNELRRDTILPLALYFLELQSHFSSEAIWTSSNSIDDT